MKKYLRALCLVLALVMTLCACSSNGGDGSSASTPSSTPSSTPDSTGGEESRVLTIGLSADIKNLDPQNHGNALTDSMIMNLSSRLLQRDNDMKLYMDLATAYEIVDDDTWKFEIRKDATFWDGTPVTSADVQYTLMRAATDESLIEYPYFKGITDVEIIDDYSFYIHTAGAKPDLLSLLAKMGGDILPKDYLEEVGMDAFQTAPMFSGQYKLKEWVADSHITLVPNENFYGETNPDWDEVVFRIIPESSTRVGELLTGGVDLIMDVPPNEWDRVDNNTDNYGTKIARGDTTRVMLLACRMTEGYATADAKVREAIELAIDKDMICNDLLQGSGTPTRTRVGSGVDGFNWDLFGSENANLYDPEKAKALLAEAGYANGLTITMDVPRGRYLMDSEMGQMIAGMLGEVGITVNLNVNDPTVHSNKWSAKENQELILMGLGDNMFDAGYPLIHYGDKERVAGLTDYDSKECQELYQAAIVNMNLEERAKQFEEIQAIAAEDRSHINICQLKVNYGVSNRINFNPRLDEFILAREITLAK